MLVFLIFFNLLFIYYFYFVGIRYFGIIPIIFLGFVIINLPDTISSSKQFEKIDYHLFFVSNAALGVWSLIMVGILGILYNLQFGYNFFSMLPNIQGYLLSDILILFVLNIILLIFSYIYQYNDGKKIFHFGMYFCLGLFLFFLFKLISWNEFINIILTIIVLLTGLYSFITFVLGVYQENIQYSYLLYLFWNFNILILIYKIGIHNLYTTILILQVYLTIQFFCIYLLNYYQKKIIAKLTKNMEAEKIDNLLHHIMSGKKLVISKKDYKTRLLLFAFFQNIPESIKFILSLLNIVFVFVQIFLFWQNIGSDQQIIYYEIIYWIAIIIFFINFLLVKIINFYYYLQRVFVFFVLNFGIYLSIINLFGQKIIYIVVIGIIWNLLNSGLIFFSADFNKKKILFAEDYYFWIISNFIAVIVNIYFLLRISMDKKLKSSIILLYLGVYLYLAMYNLKYLEKIK